MEMGELWTRVGSLMASLMFVWAMSQQFFPHQLRYRMQKYGHDLVSLVYPYLQITFHEASGEGLKRNEAYAAIRTYLGEDSPSKAKRLRGEIGKNNTGRIALCMDDNEEVTDEFHGVKLWWRSRKRDTKTQSFSYYPAPDEKRSYTLTFHRRHRKLVTEQYLDHVMKEAKAIAVRNRQRKLYTNTSRENWYWSKRWNHVAFEHPATFDTLAMDPKKKQEIINDLLKFSKGKQYYEKVGKAWKRGYLLYGPPGTGKSTMIAAMANLLDYDVYDLELTAVKDNTQLKHLLIDISSKAIIVIEDIDCSLDLTLQRKKKTEEEEDEEKKKSNSKKEKDKEDSKVTLSGLLNFIDGIWSACGSERIIIFTTNHLEKLDPALIRRGRMDKHIELSYCCFEAFKVLARNYLHIESHELYEKIECLLKEVNMIPADVAESLMPKSDEYDAETCLNNLIEALGARKDKQKEEKIRDEVKCNGIGSTEHVKENMVTY